LFTIDTLVNMLGHAGAKLRITVSRPKRSSTASITLPRRMTRRR
jgi:hypothetical protein